MSIIIIIIIILLPPGPVLAGETKPGTPIGVLNINQDTKMCKFDDAQLYRHGVKRKHGGDSRTDSTKTQRAAPSEVEKTLSEEKGDEAM